MGVVVGCGGARGDGAPIVARFEPRAQVLPMPTDMLRDPASGLLAIPHDRPGLAEADRDLARFLDTLDGWPSATPATVEFSGALDAASIDSDAVQGQGEQHKRREQKENHIDQRDDLHARFLRTGETSFEFVHDGAGSDRLTHERGFS